LGGKNQIRDQGARPDLEVLDDDFERKKPPNGDKDQKFTYSVGDHLNPIRKKTHQVIAE